MNPVPFRSFLLCIFLLFAEALYGSGYNESIYLSEGGSDDLISTGTVSIHSGGDPPTVYVDQDKTFYGRLTDGVAVYNFRNIRLPSGCVVEIMGSRPVSLTASRDIYIGCSIDVSGKIPGRAGAGIGGKGGSGGAEGEPGNGGEGGPGSGTGGSAGQGGNGQNSGTDGGDGKSESGERGEDGGDGVVGEPGDAGGVGYGDSGAPPEGGNPGDAGQGGLGGPEGSGGTGGTGGSGGQWNYMADGEDGDPGSNGGPGINGFPAEPGADGESGVSSGKNAIFDFPADTLSVAAGCGGGGGAGGSGGGAGGGAGGGGSGAGGGGGGGGGGCRYSRYIYFYDLKGGGGCAGGQGGSGGAGGSGGRGGSGGNGGNGGNAGGCIILSARGLIRLTSDCKIDISSTPPETGQPGESGKEGSEGTEGNDGFSGTTGYPPETSDLYSGGNAGPAGRGGPGGGGGKGGKGGNGGRGSDGGYATPGMLKLHASVIIADGANVNCDNHRSTTTFSSLGKMTWISNMSSDAAAKYFPSYSDDIHTGIISNDSLLKETCPWDSITSVPLIPELKNGPSASGVLKHDFWNNEEVENKLSGIPDPRSVELVRLNNVFDGFDQIFLVNTGTEDKKPFLYITVGENTPFSVGHLAPGEIWSTTVPSGANVTCQTGIPRINSWSAR